MKLDLTVVADGLGFPEGPVATQDGTLYFVDIAQQTLMRIEDGSNPEVVANIPGGPNGLAIGPDGHAYVCNNGGVFDFITAPPTPPGSQPPQDRNAYLLLPCPKCPGKHYGEYAKDAAGKPIEKTPDMAAGSICKVNLKTGHTIEIYGPSKGDSLIAPDDIVFDANGPAGSFWFTDCGFQNEKIVRKGGVYAGHVNGQRPVKMAGRFGDQVRATYDGQVIFGLAVDVVVEPSPMGTGGALALAAAEARLDPEFLLMNGDS